MPGNGKSLAGYGKGFHEGSADSVMSIWDHAFDFTLE